MPTIRTVLSAALLLAVGGGGLSADRAHALSDADKCEAGKLGEVGKYVLCRAKADAKAVKTATAADYAKCDAKLADKWPKLETAAGGQCPSNGDLAAIQSYATQCTTDLGIGLGGGTLPNCPADLSACGADLGTCESDLASCQAYADNRPEETGQTACWDQSGASIACAGSGQDGEYQYGRTLVAHTFTDNGDGTITDDKTGLMWEKESNDASIHSPQSDTWANAFVKIASLNTMAFAGHTECGGGAPARDAMARSEHLPIYKASYDLCLYLEQVVRNFSRYHKYTLGSHLRESALRLLRLIVRANNRADKSPLLLRIREETDDLKVLLRLANDCRAFPSFNSFEHAIRLVTDVARQNEGWLKSQQTARGQNRRVMLSEPAAPSAP